MIAPRVYQPQAELEQTISAMEAFDDLNDLTQISGAAWAPGYQLGDAQQPASFVVTWSTEAVFVFAVVGEGTRGHASQCCQLSPLKCRTHRGEFFADRAVVLLGVQAAVF